MPKKNRIPERNLCYTLHAMNYTYILRCKDDTFYTGWTNNLDRRIKEHNRGRGAKYTRSRRPACLVYYEEFETRGEAMRRETEIKKMDRREKEKLIGISPDIDESNRQEKGRRREDFSKERQRNLL